MTGLAASLVLVGLDLEWDIEHGLFPVPLAGQLLSLNVRPAIEATEIALAPLALGGAAPSRDHDSGSLSPARDRT